MHPRHINAQQRRVHFMGYYLVQFVKLSTDNHVRDALPFCIMIPIISDVCFIYIQLCCGRGVT